MNGNGGTSVPMVTLTRCDAIQFAVHAEIEQLRKIIDGDANLQSVVVTVHLASGGGHPRSVECGLRSEKRFPAA